MKFLLLVVFIITGFSCGKKNQNDSNGTMPQRCVIVLSTPVLDSFIYPTYYITTTVAFSDTSETVHFHADVTGDHDGSWFLPRYSVGSSICVSP